MNKINVDIDFTNGKLNLSGIDLITGDYNSTEIDFTFDEEHQENRKVFEMKSPSEEIVMLEDIVDNKIGLFGLIDITTTHNDKTYIKYIKEDLIYWYQATDEKLYDSEWNEIAEFDLTEYTKVQQKASVFGEEGYYIFEVSCYGTDSKLTSVFGKLPVNKEQIVVDGEIVQPYLPIFDQLVQDIEEVKGDITNLQDDVDTIENDITNLQNNKQDTLVSGENIKTINNESLLGSGNLEVITDLSDYYTKEQTDDLIETELEDYYNKDEIDTIKTTIESEIPTKTSDLTNDSGFIDKSVNNLENYSKTSEIISTYSTINETGNKIGLEINSSTYVLTAKLYDKNNNLLSTSTGIDLPLETMVVGASYDSATKEIVLTLKSGETTRFSVADLVDGLVSTTTLETNYYNKTQTDTLLNTKANVSDIPDLTDYVKNTDYATDSKGGVVKTNWGSGTYMSNGAIVSRIANYNVYQQLGASAFISKGTLENVITGKELTNKTYVDSANEEQDTQIQDLQEENTYLNSIIDQLPRVNGSGTSITLDNTIEAKMKSKLSPSEMTQEDTPTPETPYDIHTTTGDNVIRDEGKNIFNLDWFTYRTNNGITATKGDGYVLLNGTATATAFINYEIPISLGSETINGWFVKSDSAGLMLKIRRIEQNDINIQPTAGTQMKQNVSNDSSYVYSGYLQITNGTTLNNCKVYIDVRKGDISLQDYVFEPYTLDTYLLTLGNLEYSKIGNYEDEFIYNTTDTNLELNKWYLKKNIGKVVLDGTENWTLNNPSGTWKYYQYQPTNLGQQTTNGKLFLCNYFIATNTWAQQVVGMWFDTNMIVKTEGSLAGTETLETFTTWLSNNNPIVYYALATPEYILLNNTLQEQLTNIYNNMMSKKGTTNISQVNDELPMVITASAMLDLNSLVGA